MQIAPRRISRQRSRRNDISINALLTWRARRLRSLRLKEWEPDAIQADIDAIDRVLVNVLGKLAGWFEDYNENHPHSGLKMRSPREFIRAKTQ